MARINIEDQFWVDVGLVAAKVGDWDRAAGMALRWLKFGQDRYRSGKPISAEEFAQNFSMSLSPEFATIENGVVMVRGAEKHFSWLDHKKKAGKAGAKRTNSIRYGRTRQNSSELGKPQQISPSSSISISNSISNSSKRERVKTSAEPTLPPLAVLWNDHSGTLPKVIKTNKARDRKAHQRFEENAPDEWVKIIKRIAASDFCNGKSDRGWVATFDWLLQPETHLKVAEGKYDNRGSQASNTEIEREISEIFASRGRK